MQSYCKMDFLLKYFQDSVLSSCNDNNNIIYKIMLTVIILLIIVN